MKYQVEENCLTIFLPSEVDHHNAEKIRRKSDRLIEKHHIKCVIFDFGETNFMDSSGIGLLMGRYKLMRALGGTVRIIHAGERIRKILVLSGIHKIIPIEKES